MNSCRALGVSIAAMVAVAGLSVPAAVAQETRDASTARVAQHNYDFRSAKWMRERNVMNNNNEEIAETSDFILDRGSGVIDYAVLKTGTILGLGGKRVVVPYHSLRWDAAGESFLMPLTPEQVKELPEFSEEEWKGVADVKASTKELRKRLMTDAGPASGDPYSASLQDAKDMRIKGEVTKVERIDQGEFGEQVVLTVKTTDGDRRVALGPSWYVNSGLFAPMRGDEVSVEALVLPRDPQRTLAARSVAAGGRDIVLRDREGKPTWWLKSDETPEQRANASRRYLLLSSVLGGKVDCRGTECGRVHDVITERRSGALAFLSIDPNENFLGIADSKRLVPWSVVTVSSDAVVRLDASKEMVLASPETPDELSTLNSGGVIDQAYKAYQVDAPRFQPRAVVDVDARRPGPDAWSRDGAIWTSIKKDARTVAGTQRDIDKVSLGDLPDAHAITVTEAGKDVLVLLGPAWYVKNQKLTCKDGDMVKVETYRASINGKDYLIARSLECNGGRVIFIDESGAPAWDRK